MIACMYVIAMCIPAYIVGVVLTFVCWPVIDYLMIDNSGQHYALEKHFSSSTYVVNDRARMSLILMWAWPIVWVVATVGLIVMFGRALSRLMNRAISTTMSLVCRITRAIGIAGLAKYLTNPVSKDKMLSYAHSINDMWGRLLVKKPKPLPHDGPYR